MTEIENSYSKHFLINKCNSAQKFKILPYYNKNKQLFLNKNLNENFSFFFTPKNSKTKKTNINFPNINNITTISNPFRLKKQKSLKKIKLKILNESKKNYSNSTENKNNFNLKTEEYLTKEKKFINDLSKISTSRKKIFPNKTNKNKKNFSPLNTNSKSELNKIITKIHFNQNNKKIQSTIIDLSKQRNKLNKFYQNIKNLLNKDYEKYYKIPLEDLIQLNYNN